jgi:hypothetical protein
VGSTIDQARSRSNRGARGWLAGAGAVAIGAALIATVAVQPAAAPVVPAVDVASPPALATTPIQGYAVEGTQGYEWRIKSAMDGYAVVDGPFGYEVVGNALAAATAIDGMVPMRVKVSEESTSYATLLVSAEDGYYDEGSQGYEWRLRRR